MCYNILIIENKIFSGEHSDQLKKYENIIEKEYIDYLADYITNMINFKFVKKTKTYLAFTSFGIYEKFKDFKIDGWEDGSTIMRFEISNGAEQIRLRLVLLPCETQIRHKVLEYFSNLKLDNKDFNKIKKNENGWKEQFWTTLYLKDIHKSKDIQYENFDDTKEIIDKF